MKGADYMTIITAVVFAIIVIMLVFAYWNPLQKSATKEGSKALDTITVGVGAVFLVPFLKRKMAKKGIVVTTNLLVIIVFVTIVIFFLLMIYLSLTAEAGSTSSSFAYGVFDSILRRLW